MGWPTLDSGISPRRGDAIICRLEKKKKKKKRKRMKEPRQRESYSSSSYVSLISSWSLRSLIRKLVSLKDSRARWCDGPATVPTEYDKHEGTEWVFRFLGLFSLSLSLSLSFSQSQRTANIARHQGMVGSFFPPLSIKLPYIFILFLTVSQKY